MERHLNDNVPAPFSGFQETEASVPSSPTHTFRMDSRPSSAPIGTSVPLLSSLSPDPAFTTGSDVPSDSSTSRKSRFARFASVEGFQRVGAPIQPILWRSHVSG
ncbi:hypothetical protein L915_21931 [Phytophthora nicotianae]|uniref:Uncharacterized protein n=1 Tax=Phytophthora nicotianae TaxID=4792 RepID=W2J5F0_PHYNI|nr:hypothetical protein L915_21931 [Phytophthora nicotianae]ETL41591.1 hypothetical protein L916_07476 [Phytophthora nicotianae]